MQGRRPGTVGHTVPTIVTNDDNVSTGAWAQNERQRRTVLPIQRHTRIGNESNASTVHSMGNGSNTSHTHVGGQRLLPRNSPHTNAAISSEDNGQRLYDDLMSTGTPVLASDSNDYNTYEMQSNSPYIADMDSDEDTDTTSGSTNGSVAGILLDKANEVRHNLKTGKKRPLSGPATLMLAGLFIFIGSSIPSYFGSDAEFPDINSSSPSSLMLWCILAIISMVAVIGLFIFLTLTLFARTKENKLSRPMSIGLIVTMLVVMFGMNSSLFAKTAAIAQDMITGPQDTTIIVHMKGIADTSYDACESQRSSGPSICKTFEPASVDICIRLTTDCDAEQPYRSMTDKYDDYPVMKKESSGFLDLTRSNHDWFVNIYKAKLGAELKAKAYKNTGILTWVAEPTNDQLMTKCKDDSRLDDSLYGVCYDTTWDAGLTTRDYDMYGRRK